MLPALLATFVAALPAPAAPAPPPVAAVPAAPAAIVMPAAATLPLAQRRGRRGGFRRRTPSTRSARRNRGAARRAFRGILQVLGIAFLVNMLFGWGAGGSPLGLILLGAIIAWLVLRRRRRPAYRS
jgi:hypothetical protein